MTNEPSVQPSLEPTGSDSAPSEEAQKSEPEPGTEVATTTPEPQKDELALLSVSGDTELDDIKRYAVIMYHAGFFGDLKGTQTQQVAQAIVKIIAGREIGLGPIASMQGVYVTKEGRVAYMSNLVAQAIKRSSRYDYRVRQIDDERCIIDFRERARALPEHRLRGISDDEIPYESIGTSEFSMEDAERAGLARKDNWAKYPRAMLFARALTAGVRWYCPDLFDGPVYTRDEVEAETPPEIIDVELMKVKGDDA